MKFLCLPAIVAVSGIAVLGSPLSAQDEADPPPRLDPQAIEVLSGAAEFLSGQTALSVDWFVSYDEVVDGREKLTFIRSGHNLIDRAAGLYSYVENGPETREFFYDGSQFQIYDVEEDAYVMVPFSGDLETLAERIRSEHDLVLPIWSVMSRASQSELVGRAEQAAYLGTTRIAGQVAHHVALSSYDDDWQVWIADDAERPELLMLVGTDPYTQGWPQYRVYFTNWDFDPEIVDGAFSFEPGDESTRMAWPKSARASN